MKSPQSILIRNVKIVAPPDSKANSKPDSSDILIRDGRIDAIEPSARKIAVSADVTTIDGRGIEAAAGFIDMHTHLREPGQTYKEDLMSGSRAAAKGGFTTVVCMANTTPPMDSAELIQNVRNRSRENCLVNVYPVGTVTMGMAGEHLTDFLGLIDAGAIALSDDGFPIRNSRLMVDALKLSRIYDILLLLHEEDETLSNGCLIRDGEISYELGLPGYHSFAEELMVIRDLHLVEKIGGRVHFCHIASRYSLPHIASVKAAGSLVTSEVTPHHLALTSDSLRNLDPNFKMSPPLGHAEDQEALVAAFNEGILDVIASDHAPHAYHEKDILLADAKHGITGLETTFGVLCTLVKNKKITLERAIQSITEAPAKILRLEKKGRLAVGMDGDVVLFSSGEQWTYSRDTVCSKSLNSPMLGNAFFGKIRATVVGGRLVYDSERPGWFPQS